MSLRRDLFAATLACCALLGAGTAVAGPWNLAPGEYYSELLGSYSISNHFWDDGSAQQVSPTPFEQRGVTSMTTLGWTKRANFVIGLPVRSATVGTGANAVTSSGYGDVTLGVNYALHTGPSALGLHVRWEAPTGLNKRFSSSLTDGLQKLEADLQYGTKLGKRGWVELGGGYRYDYRTIGSRSTDVNDVAGKRDWSDHTIADATLGMWLGGALNLAGQYHGSFAGATGRQVAGADLKTSAQYFGPRLTYRVDDKLDAFAGSWHTLAGQNVMSTDEFYIGFAWKQTKLNRLQGFFGNSKL